MGQKKIGLPASFDLGVSEDDLQPADIGDFLDGDIQAPVRRRPEPEAVEPPPVAQPEPAVVQPESPPARVAAEATERIHHSEPVKPEASGRVPQPLLDVPERRQPLQRPKRGRPKRVELNVDPTLERQMQGILNDVRSQSFEDDVRMSELHRALWQALHQARQEIDYSSVPARGQWGSATAHALVSELKEAFLKGIGAYYVKHYYRGAKDELE